MEKTQFSRIEMLHDWYDGVRFGLQESLKYVPNSRKEEVKMAIMFCDSQMRHVARDGGL